MYAFNILLQSEATPAIRLFKEQRDIVVSICRKPTSLHVVSWMETYLLLKSLNGLLPVSRFKRYKFSCSSYARNTKILDVRSAG